MGDLSYKNLVSKLSSGGKMKSRKDRIETCVQFVADTVPIKTLKSRLAIQKGVTILDATFMKKWREAKGVKERFEGDNENWLQIDLKVRRTLHIS